MDADEIDLSWNVAAMGVTQSQLFRAAGGGAYSPLATLGASATGYQDTGLSAGTFYSYRLRTVGFGGVSSFADVESYTLEDTTQTLPTITVTSGQNVDGVLADFSQTFSDTDPSHYSATVDWGDGASDTGVVAPDGHGGFAVSGSHLYTVPALDVMAISLQKPGVYATVFCGVLVPDAHPTVVAGASATLSPDGTTATLSVLGDDAAGEEDLSYTWCVLGTPPAAVTFDDNGDNDAQQAVATFTATGRIDRDRSDF